jgi:hypothetical protein
LDVESRLFEKAVAEPEGAKTDAMQDGNDGHDLDSPLLKSLDLLSVIQNHLPDGGNLLGNISTMQLPPVRYRRCRGA